MTTFFVINLHEHDNVKQSLASNFNVLFVREKLENGY